MRRTSSRYLLRDPLEVPEQVFNANADPCRTLVPVSQAPVETVRRAWAPLLPDCTPVVVILV